MSLRDVAEQDFPVILRLNQAVVDLTSPMDLPKLSALHNQSYYHRVIEVDGKVAGFLLAFAAGADYQSLNYQWFDQRFERFLYIDRVVIDADFRGRSLGATCYQDLIQVARAANLNALVCEYNSQPINKVSEQFHRGFGFVEIGQQKLPGGKVVSMQQLTL